MRVSHDWLARWYSESQRGPARLRSPKNCGYRGYGKLHGRFAGKSVELRGLICSNDRKVLKKHEADDLPLHSVLLNYDSLVVMERSARCDRHHRVSLEAIFPDALQGLASIPGPFEYSIG